MATYRLKRKFFADAAEPTPTPSTNTSGSGSSGNTTGGKFWGPKAKFAAGATAAGLAGAWYLEHKSVKKDKEREKEKELEGKGRVGLMNRFTSAGGY